MRTSMSARQFQTMPTEAGMQEAVQQLVDLRGGRLFHVRRSDVAPELTDLLDWLIVDPRAGRVLLIEAKSQTRLITRGQADLLTMLRECDRFETGVVRPEPLGPAEIAYTSFLDFLGGSD